ncbi:MAG: hypothetical protein KAI43_06630 [Candidatus Aureabacteria bacterium]|nr:hypothetical protein [Candidatus Auribacterota bacterium]
MKNFVFAILFSLVLSLCSFVFSDDVIDSINEGIEQYKNKQYKSAIESFEYASGLLRQKRSEMLATFLPEAMIGWQSGEAESSAITRAMFGGGISAKRKYTKGTSSVEINCMTDSPILQSMMILFTNPLFTQGEDTKMVRINGQKAIVEYDKTLQSGKITIIVASKIIVTVKGTKVLKEDIISYVEKIDFKAMTLFQ